MFLATTDTKGNLFRVQNFSYPEKQSAEWRRQKRTTKEVLHNHDEEVGQLDLQKIQRGGSFSKLWQNHVKFVIRTSKRATSSNKMEEIEIH